MNCYGLTKQQAMRYSGAELRQDGYYVDGVRVHLAELYRVAAARARGYETTVLELPGSKVPAPSTDIIPGPATNTGGRYHYSRSRPDLMARAAAAAESALKLLSLQGVQWNDSAKHCGIYRGNLLRWRDGNIKNLSPEKIAGVEAYVERYEHLLTTHKTGDASA